MLIPRYSLRWLLGLTTLCAVVSLVLASAVRGEVWAVGVIAVLASAVLLAGLHVGTFLAAWMLSLFERATFSKLPQEGGSPFAATDSPFGPAAVPVSQPPSDSPPLTG